MKFQDYLFKYQDFHFKHVNQLQDLIIKSFTLVSQWLVKVTDTPPVVCLRSNRPHLSVFP